MLAAVILAAGESRRFGSPKALAQLGGRMAIHHVLGRAQDFDLSPIVVVLGHKWDLIQPHLKDTNATLVRNKNYAIGQFSSLQMGLRAIQNPVKGLVLFLVDQPWLEPSTLKTLISVFQSNPHCIVKPVWKGRGGHPVIIPWSLRKRILLSESTQTARNIFAGYDERVDVEVDDPFTCIQFNTAEELKKLETALQKGLAADDR